MPTPRYHICSSYEVSQKLNKKYNIDELLLGSILPDETFSEHYLSHYQNKEGSGNESLPNIEAFEKDERIKNSIHSESILAGYKIHLLSDKFFNEYFNNKFDGKNEDELKAKKHSDTFEYERYLLLNKNLPQINLSDAILDEINDAEDIKFNKEDLKRMINSFNKDISKNKFERFLEKIFCFMHFKFVTKKEMDKLYLDLINYVYQNMKN